MAGLSQAEIDAVQASRRRKEAEGGGHPSFQGENKGTFQTLTTPSLFTEVEVKPQNLQFDPRSGVVNLYDDRYRRALANFERGTPLNQEEIVGRMQLGQQAAQAHRAMRGSGPLGAAAGMRPLVQQQLGISSRMGQARGQREISQKQALMSTLQEAAQVDIAKAAAESARLRAVSAFKRQAQMDEDAAEKMQRSQYALGAATAAGEIQDWYNKDKMKTYA